jgi:hypothetical protein
MEGDNINFFGSTHTSPVRLPVVTDVKLKMCTGYLTIFFFKGSLLKPLYLHSLLQCVQLKFAHPCRANGTKFGCVDAHQKPPNNSRLTSSVWIFDTFLAAPDRGRRGSHLEQMGVKSVLLPRVFR